MGLVPEIKYLVSCILYLVKSATLHTNLVKQYTKFKVGGHVFLVVKILLHTPFCGCCGKCSIEIFFKRWILECFVVNLNIMLP